MSKIIIDGLSIADTEQVQKYLQTCFPDAETTVLIDKKSITESLGNSVLIPMDERFARKGVVVLSKSNPDYVWVVTSVNTQTKILNVKYVGQVKQINWFEKGFMPEIEVEPTSQWGDTFEADMNNGHLIFYAWGLPK